MEYSGWLFAAPFHMAAYVNSQIQPHEPVQVK